MLISLLWCPGLTLVAALQLLWGHVGAGAAGTSNVPAGGQQPSTPVLGVHSTQERCKGLASVWLHYSLHFKHLLVLLQLFFYACIYLNIYVCIHLHVNVCVHTGPCVPPVCMGWL